MIEALSIPLATWDAKMGLKLNTDSVRSLRELIQSFIPEDSSPEDMAMLGLLKSLQAACEGGSTSSEIDKKLKVGSALLSGIRRHVGFDCAVQIKTQIEAIHKYFIYQELSEFKDQAVDLLHEFCYGSAFQTLVRKFAHALEHCKDVEDVCVTDDQLLETCECIKIACNLTWAISLQLDEEVSHGKIALNRAILVLGDELRTLFEAWLINLPQTEVSILTNAERYISTASKLADAPPQANDRSEEAHRINTNFSPTSQSYFSLCDQESLGAQVYVQLVKESQKIEALKNKVIEDLSTRCLQAQTLRSKVCDKRDSGLEDASKHQALLEVPVAAVAQLTANKSQQLETDSSKAFVDAFGQHLAQMKRADFFDPFFGEKLSSYLDERSNRQREGNHLVDSRFSQSIDDFQVVSQVFQAISMSQPLDLLALNSLLRGKLQSLFVRPSLDEVNASVLSRFCIQLLLILQATILRAADVTEMRSSSIYDDDVIEAFRLRAQLDVALDNVQACRFQEAAVLVEAITKDIESIQMRLKSISPIIDHSALNQRFIQLQRFKQTLRQKCAEELERLRLLQAFDQTSLVRFAVGTEVEYKDELQANWATWINPKSVKRAMITSEIDSLESVLSCTENVTELLVRGRTILRLRRSVLRSLNDEIGESPVDVMSHWYYNFRSSYFGAGSIEMFLIFEMELRNQFIAFLLSDTTPTVSQILLKAYDNFFGVDKEDQTNIVIAYCSAILDLTESGQSRRYYAAEHIPRFNGPLLTLPSIEEHYNSKVADMDKRLEVILLLENAQSSLPVRGPRALVALLTLLRNGVTDFYSFHPSSFRENAEELLEAFKTFFEESPINVDTSKLTFKLAQLVSIATFTRRQLIEQHIESMHITSQQIGRSSDFLKLLGKSIGVQESQLDTIIGDLQFVHAKMNTPKESKNLDKYLRHLSPRSRQASLDADGVSQSVHPNSMFQNWTESFSQLRGVLQNHLSSGVYVQLRAWEVKTKIASIQCALIAELEAPIELSECKSRVETGLLFSRAYQRLKVLAKGIDKVPYILDGLQRAVTWTLQMCHVIASEAWSELMTLREQLAVPFGGLALYGPNRLLAIAESIMRHNLVFETIVSQFWPTKNGKGCFFEEESEGFFPFIDFRKLIDAVDSAAMLELQTFELSQLVKIADSLIKMKGAMDQGQWIRRQGDQGGDFVLDILKVFPRIHCPRHIVVELEKIEVELQNINVELGIVEIISSGRSYLSSGDLRGHQYVEIDSLEQLIESAARLRHRNGVSSTLFDLASRILNLRRAVKYGDWATLRYWLSGPLPPFSSVTSSEAIFEIETLREISKRNLNMHKVLVNAMSQNAITGDAMKLNAEAVAVSNLLVALRVASAAPKISIEDEQLLHSAEKLKDIRICFMMQDFAKLIEEIAMMNLGLIHNSCLEEFYLIKKAADTNSGLERIRKAISEERPCGAVGSVSFLMAQSTELEGSLSLFDKSSTTQVVSYFLECASNVLALRISARTGRWCVKELADAMLSNEGQLVHEGYSIVNIDFTKEIFGGMTHADKVKGSSMSRTKQHQQNFGPELRTAAFISKEYEVDGFQPLESQNMDISNETIFISKSLANVHQDYSVPSLLLLTARAGILCEHEEEFLLIRDELYNKIGVHLLRSCLTREPGLLELSDALRVVGHLGIKSKECGKLLYSAYFIRSLRESHRKGDVRRTISLLGRVGRLNDNGSLSSLIHDEVETIYREVCGDSILTELYKSLEFEGQGAEIQLKRALHRSTALTPQSESISVAALLCTTSLELRKALRYGVAARIEALVQKGEHVLSLKLSSSSEEFARSRGRIEDLLDRARTHLQQLSIGPAADIHPSPPSRLVDNAKSTVLAPWERTMLDIVNLITDAAGSPLVLVKSGSLNKYLERITQYTPVESYLELDRFNIAAVLSWILLGALVDAPVAGVSVSSSTILSLTKMYPVHEAKNHDGTFPFRPKRVAQNLVFPVLGKVLRRVIPILLNERSRRIWVQERLKANLAKSSLKEMVIKLLTLKQGLHEV